jgi:hypothetical protein
MKKIWMLVTVFVLVAFSFAMAQTIYWADQKTVTWDAPITLVDGSPIPPEDVLAYNMYMRHEDALPTPVRGDYATQEEYETAYTNYLADHFVETVPIMPYTYTVPEGLYQVGVSAVRYIGGAGFPFESEVTWSDFLLGYGRVTQAVTGFRVP